MPSVETRIAYLEREINKLKTRNAAKPKWVRVSVITELTGWNKEKMRQARDNNLIEWKTDDGFWYDLNSLHPLLIKQSS